MAGRHAAPRREQRAGLGRRHAAVPGEGKPIVALTSHQGSERGWIDPAALHASLGSAGAWRCALKHAPSAPRLHWWNVPGESGPSIEFACVGLHDHVDIPE